MNDIMMSPGLSDMIAFEEVQSADIECCVKFTTTAIKGRLGKFLVHRDKQKNIDAVNVMLFFKKEQICDAISCAQVIVETVRLFKHDSCIFTFNNDVEDFGGAGYTQECVVEVEDCSMLLSFEKKVL